MNHDITINLLRHGFDPCDPAEWRLRMARAAWAGETLSRLRQAQGAADEAWARILAELPEDISDEELDAMNLPDPPEQTELNALSAEIDAMIQALIAEDEAKNGPYRGGI